MNKVYTLHDAIAKYVETGDCISFGGFTTNRKPYAAVAEILRQGQGDFTVWAGPAAGRCLFYIRLPELQADRDGNTYPESPQRASPDFGQLCLPAEKRKIPFLQCFPLLSACGPRP